MEFAIRLHRHATWNNWEDIDNYSVYLEILLLAVCSGFVIWFVIKKPQDNFIHYLL